MSEEPHVAWTVSTTSYLRNLDREDLRSECVAVHHQSALRETERGTSIGLVMPMLIVSFYCGNQHEVAERVAMILNKHWDDDLGEAK